MANKDSYLNSIEQGEKEKEFVVKNLDTGETFSLKEVDKLNSKALQPIYLENRFNKSPREDEERRTMLSSSLDRKIPSPLESPITPEKTKKYSIDNKHSFLPNPPTLVEYNSYKFLIFDAPTSSNLELYIKEFKKYNVVHVVRTCDPTYSKHDLENANILVTDLAFPDGGTPSDSIVNEWLCICKDIFEKHGNECTIGVHCVAGFGRAPLLVTIILIELGLKYDESVEMIRQKRHGAININQLAYLKNYKPKAKKCIIM